MCSWRESCQPPELASRLKLPWRHHTSNSVRWQSSTCVISERFPTISIGSFADLKRAWLEQRNHAFWRAGLAKCPSQPVVFDMFELLLVRWFCSAFRAVGDGSANLRLACALAFGWLVLLGCALAGGSASSNQLFKGGVSPPGSFPW
jgi:hypothetical protein